MDGGTNFGMGLTLAVPMGAIAMLACAGGLWPIAIVVAVIWAIIMIKDIRDTFK